MNHDLLKNIIYDQHELIQNADIVARPSYSFEPNANYVLVGLRRAGKSTLLFKIVQDLVAKGVTWEQIIYINFEDERLSEFQKEDFNDILSVQSELSAERGYFFFDEIQIVPGWEKFCRRMADAKEHVYVTGSNASMLSQEISTTLGGRYLTKYVTPYDFDEYLTAQNVPHDTRALLQTKANGRIRSYCAEYLQYGGFPEAIQYTAKREYISSVYQKILLGDIITRNGIRNDYAIKILMKKLAESVKSEISYTKLHGILKSIGISVGKESIIDYTKENIRGAYASLDNFIRQWSAEDKKETIRELLRNQGIDLEAIKADQGMSDVDDFDFICHVAFDKKPLTRRERAENVKKKDFLNKYSGAARTVLEALLDKYMNTGIYEIEKTEILRLDPFMQMGKPQKIASYFGGKDGYLKAVKELEQAIYEGGAA